MRLQEINYPLVSKKCLIKKKLLIIYFLNKIAMYMASNDIDFIYQIRNPSN